MDLGLQSWKTERELSLAIDDAATTAKFDAEFHRVWDRSAMAYEGTGCTAR